LADRSDTSIDQPQPDVRGYDAFLSYSSSDAVRVKRVQRFLETYKDKDSGRTLRVFLDQTDIRGGSLRPEIESALAASTFLIVCCSPAAADSHWVNAEVSSFLTSRLNPNIALILLAGEPGDAIPARARALEPRYHDLRAGWIAGVMKPRTRDELLRLLALLTSRDLRSLIDWQRRRMVVRLGLGAIAAAASTGGVAWYVRSQRRIHATDVMARIEYQPQGEGADASFLEIFKTDVKFHLFGAPTSTAPSVGTLRWPKEGSLLGRKPPLNLTSDRQTLASSSRPTVDGTAYAAIRTFTDFGGQLGPFTDPATWNGAIMDARVVAIVPRATPVQGRLEVDAPFLRTQFDEHYRITQADRDRWGDDYSTTPLPIRATLEILLGGRPVGRSQGLVAHLREWDEDVRGLHVVAFPPFVLRTS
jgi:hypothetical protein